MGRRILRVAPELIAHYCKDGTGMTEVIANALPEDARIVDATMDGPKNMILLVIESASYPDSEGLPLTDVAPPQFCQTRTADVP